MKSGWIGAFAAVAALGLFVLIGCQSNHSQSTAAATAATATKNPDQLAIESAVQRTVFTDLLQSAQSTPASNSSDDSHYFVSLPDSADPSPTMLAQLHKIASVQPISKAPSHDDFLTGSITGTNTIFQINQIQLLDATTATADAIQTSTPMAAAAWHYTLTHDHTGWHITAKQPTGAA